MGLRQAELASLLGVSSISVTRWELGDIDFSSKWHLISNALQYVSENMRPEIERIKQARAKNKKKLAA
jgi:DNA-binding XRE family transcriptional regulator